MSVGHRVQNRSQLSCIGHTYVLMRAVFWNGEWGWEVWLKRLQWSAVRTNIKGTESTWGEKTAESRRICPAKCVGIKGALFWCQMTGCGALCSSARRASSSAQHQRFKFSLNSKWRHHHQRTDCRECSWRPSLLSICCDAGRVGFRSAWSAPPLTARLMTTNPKRERTLKMLKQHLSAVVFYKMVSWL